jgi:hypothetical protein
MRFSTRYGLMIHGVYDKKIELLQHILSSLISYQTRIKLLIITLILSLKLNFYIIS